jgi:hypothetical protein
MDRQAVVGMVEDYWRAYVPAMQNSGIEAALEINQRFEERIERTAERLDPIEAAAFLQTIDAEREKLMAEYMRDPVALKDRLGIPLGVDEPRTRRRQGSDLGGLAVRTAVRATVWESIWALFRR